MEAFRLEGAGSTHSSCRTLCVPECIVDKRRKAVVGPSYSGLEISEELASVVAKKAFAFGVQIVDEMLNADDRHGQAGLIQNPHLATQDSQKVIDRYGDCTQQKQPAIKKARV